MGWIKPRITSPKVTVITSCKGERCYYTFVRQQPAPCLSQGALEQIQRMLNKDDEGAVSASFRRETGSNSPCVSIPWGEECWICVWNKEPLAEAASGSHLECEVAPCQHRCRAREGWSRVTLSREHMHSVERRESKGRSKLRENYS